MLSVLTTPFHDAKLMQNMPIKKNYRKFVRHLVVDIDILWWKNLGDIDKIDQKIGGTPF